MDNGQLIDIVIDSSPVQSDEDLKSNSRMVLGYLSAKYLTDADITVTLFFKRNDDMEWESLQAATLSLDKKRYFGKLPLGLTVIYDYVEVTAAINYIFEITSLKVHQKPLMVGKFG